MKPRLFLPFRKPCQSSAERDRADGLVPAVERHLAGWRPAIGMIFVFRLSALKSLNKTLSPERRLPGFGSGSLMSGQNDKAEQPTHGKSGSVP